MSSEGYTFRDNRGSREIEVRDPRGATSSASVQGIGRRALPTGSVDHHLQVYDANWLVNRAINVLADTISQLPFRAGLDLEKPSEFSQNAPLARLLGPPPEGPNPEFSARALWKLAVKNYLVTGAFAWEIEAGQGNGVAGLWPLVMGAFEAVPSHGGRAYFDGFKYQVERGQPVEFKREEVVYGWRASSGDPRQPESVLSSLRLNAHILIQLDQYNYAFIANDAKPATLIVHGPMPDKATSDAFKRQFLSNYRGPQNANKTAFAEVDPSDDGGVGGMIDIKTIGASAKDSKMVEIYEQQLRAISGGTGVPMSLLDASGRTFDNAGQEAYNYYDLTVMPLLADLQDVINRDLAPKVGNEVGWFDISDVDALKPRLSPGVTFSDVKDDLLRNERRTYVGLGPVDQKELDAEKAANIEQQRQNFLATAPPKPELAPAPAQPIPAPGPPQATKTVAKAELPVPAVKRDGKELEAVIARARLLAVSHTTGLLQRQLARFDERSAKATLSRADGKRGRQAITDTGVRVDALYDRDFWLEEARAALAPVYEAALGTASAALEGHLPLEADLTDWVDRRSGDLARQVVLDREEALVGLLSEPGLGQEDVVAAIYTTHAQRDDVATMAISVVEDAIRAVTGISTDVVRDLLTKLTSGEIDLDRAMGELL